MISQSLSLFSPVTVSLSKVISSAWSGSLNPSILISGSLAFISSSFMVSWRCISFLGVGKVVVTESLGVGFGYLTPWEPKGECLERRNLCFQTIPSGLLFAIGFCLSRSFRGEQFSWRWMIMMHTDAFEWHSRACCAIHSYIVDTMVWGLLFHHFDIGQEPCSRTVESTVRGFNLWLRMLISQRRGWCRAMPRS